MQGETKNTEIEIDESLLKAGKYKLVIESYNNK